MACCPGSAALAGNSPDPSSTVFDEYENNRTYRKPGSLKVYNPKFTTIHGEPVEPSEAQRVLMPEEEPLDSAVRVTREQWLERRQGGQKIQGRGAQRVPPRDNELIRYRFKHRDETKAEEPEETSSLGSGGFFAPFSRMFSLNEAHAEVPPPTALPSYAEAEITTRVAELARGLAYDPKRIFEYVLNQIEYRPYFGSKLGATGTLLSGAGNDCDQASLLIALMRASGYDADYVYAPQVYYLVSDLAQLLNVENDFYLVRDPFAQGGVPVIPWDPLDYDQVYLSRIWTRVTIGGQTYDFDPAFGQMHSRVSGLNLGPVLGYQSTDFWNAAMSGATTQADPALVRNMNEDLIRRKLTDYSANLIDHIRKESPNAKVHEVFGGRVVDFQDYADYMARWWTSAQEYPDWPQPAQSIGTQYVMDELPESLRSKVTVTLCGQSYDFDVYQLSDHRLTLSYLDQGATVVPQLKLDGQLVTPALAAVASGSYNLVVSDIDNPYAGGDGTYGDLQLKFNADNQAGHVYCLLFDFGIPSREYIQARNRVLSRNRYLGYPQDSELVMGETLHVIGLKYRLENKTLKDHMSRFFNCEDTVHGVLCVTSRTNGCGVDGGGGATQSPWSTWNYPVPLTLEHAFLGLGSGLEHALLEQGYAGESISTTKFLQVNNARGDATLRLTADNLQTVIGQGLLHNFSAADLASFQEMVNDGYTLYLPQEANIVLNDYCGWGYFGVNPDGRLGGIISGGMNGGKTTVAGQTANPAKVNNDNTTTMSTPTSVEVKEPVDMVTGHEVIDRVDLSLGSGEAPLGLAMSRHYDSSRPLIERRTMGFGWTHGYDIRLEENSNPDPALGFRNPVDLAPVMAGLYVLKQIMTEKNDEQSWLANAIISKWILDQLKDNAVTVHAGGKHKQFIRLATGELSPPPGVTTELIENPDGTRTLAERFDTRLDFNTDGLITSWRDADGNTLSFTYASGVLSQVTDAFGRSMSFTYDGSGNLTGVADSTGRGVAYAYTNGKLTGFTDAQNYTWTLGYDPYYRLATIVNPRQYTSVTNVYDSQDRVITQTNARGKTWHFYYSGYRNFHIDPLERWTEYYFDRDANLIATIDPEGNKAKRDYDGQGHLVASYLPSSPGTPAVVNEYDGENNLIRTTKGGTLSDHMVYDDQHHLIHKYRYSFSHRTSMEYDAEHHLVSQTDAEGNATTYTYLPNGLVHTITDAEGNRTVHTYDAYGNLSQVVVQDPQQNTVRTVGYTFNARGEMLSMTTPSGSYAFAYDNRGLMTGLTNPLSKSYAYTYDGGGNLTARTDAKNQTINYTYGPTDLLTQKAYPDASTVTYAHDDADRVTSMTDTNGTSQYVYDGRDLLTSYTNPHGVTLANVYDVDGFQVSGNWGGRTTVKSWNKPFGMLINLHQNRWTVMHLAQWNLDPYLGTVRFLSNCHLTPGVVGRQGVITQMTYDRALRLTRLSHAMRDESSDPEYQEVSDYAFALDGLGSRLAEVRRETAQPTFTAENLSHTFNAADQISTAGYVYDDNGNLTAKPGYTFAYDYENRLVSLTGPQGATTHAYDGDGNRLSATHNGVVTRYLVDPTAPNAPVIAELDAGNNLVRRYVYGAGRLLWQEDASGFTNRYLYDGTGNTAAIYDESENLVNSYLYSPFGGKLAASETVTNPFQYGGAHGVMTEPSGLLYMKARYYDPTLRRFINADPIGFEGGDINLYRYAANNPLVYVDPLGLCTRQLGAGIQGGLGLGGGISGGIVWGYSQKHGFELGFYLTVGAGPYGGYGMDAFGEFSFSENAGIESIEGWAWSAGSSVVYGIGGGGELTVAENMKPITTVVAGGGAGGEGHMFRSGTMVIKVYRDRE